MEKRLHQSHEAGRLGRSFFDRPAIEVASSLLGTVMVRTTSGVVRRARIVEVEAYLGPKDLASHASKSRTKRTDVMFGPAGIAYVYFIYGLHQMFNIITGPAGGAQAILIRAAEPLDGWEADLSGPARFARGFEITAADNRMDLAGNDIHFIIDPSDYRPRIRRSKRIGIDYARHWKNRLLRFIDVSNPVAKRLRI
ncbi:MAG TPA: DNA-3-methyladenine glycosylase [Tepidisphaeraceae bacterium]|jgi:DNA-3-methyladenine glycosylase|nr:DNA-3-methyladenine glycosylase [Tepidisphaeraceae bacterium]